MHPDLVNAFVFTGAGGRLPPTGYLDATIPAITVRAAALLGSAVIALFLPFPPRLGRASVIHTGTDR